ncbi:MAG TPA: hypothetical protein EYP78_03900 [Candidatus Omnitrophica bacterium]|nr:hypothetical protein [Candidatus Omnitrophota bacterium]
MIPPRPIIKTVSPPEVTVDFSTPARTFDTYIRAFEAENFEVVYKCFSKKLKGKNNGFLERFSETDRRGI